MEYIICRNQIYFLCSFIIFSNKVHNPFDDVKYGLLYDHHLHQKLHYNLSICTKIGNTFSYVDFSFLSCLFIVPLNLILKELRTFLILYIEIRRLFIKLFLIETLVRKHYDYICFSKNTKERKNKIKENNFLIFGFIMKNVKNKIKKIKYN